MRRRFIRLVFFTIAILVGLALGIIFGWTINPVTNRNTDLTTLHIDYKTDYVLMIAEGHHQDGDVSLALEHLGYLGNVPPLVMLENAVDHAERIRYAPEDLRLIYDLAAAIQIKLDE